MSGTAGVLEVYGRPARQRARLGLRGPQFTEIADGLFEVIAEDLRAWHGRCQENVLKPVREAVVQLGAKRLGDRSVRCLLDQDVAEAVFLHGARYRAALVPRVPWQ